jgi:hypothetical protein
MQLVEGSRNCASFGRRYLSLNYCHTDGRQVTSLGAQYDPATGYFFFPNLGQWCAYDESSQQYVPVPSDISDSAAQSTAAAAGSGTGEGGAGDGGASGLGPDPAQKRPPAAASGAGSGAGGGGPPRRAVIGAAPQYNPHALLLAAAMLPVRYGAVQSVGLERAVCVCSHHRFWRFSRRTVPPIPPPWFSS